MNSTEKEISYTTTNSYSTLNTLTKKTKYVWFVCHGMGYLSRYFLKYFKDFNADEHYFIAPQAPSKYYVPPKFTYVGASWLTKENTVNETENIMRYFDAVLESEQLPSNVKLMVVGYSQGVSVAMRYIAKRQLKCDQLVIMSGGIPKELVADDFTFLKDTTTITLTYGMDDEYLSKERMQYEQNRVHELFGDTITIVPFEGKHEVNVTLLHKLIEE
jgi:predicted esterase